MGKGYTHGVHDDLLCQSQGHVGLRLPMSGDILGPPMVTAPGDADSTDSTALARLADELARRGLALPAAMLVQVIQPFGFLCSQALLLLEPLVGPAARRYGDIVARPDRLGRLLELLETPRPPADDAEGR